DEAGGVCLQGHDVLGPGHQQHHHVATAPAPEPAPPPSAPALPFVYLGTLNPEAAKPQVFISSGDRLLIVSPGDVIDGVYRFESIAATEARFTYLPLNQRQVMSVQGEGN
ncbi:hypothetical protein ACQCQ4_25815, partial [Ralstonia pseudosolanacearum]